MDTKFKIAVLGLITSLVVAGVMLYGNAQDQRDQIEQLNAENLELEQKVTELEEVNEELEEVREERDELRERVSDLEDENRNIRNTNRELEEKIEKLGDRYQFSYTKHVASPHIDIEDCGEETCTVRVSGWVKYNNAVEIGVTKGNEYSRAKTLAPSDSIVSDEIIFEDVPIGSQVVPWARYDTMYEPWTDNQVEVIVEEEEQHSVRVTREYECWVSQETCYGP